MKAEAKRKYSGNDNHGRPESDYIAELEQADETALKEKARQMIWLSSCAANNPRSDYHRQVDACYDECAARDRRDIYEAAYKAVEQQIQGYCHGIPSNSNA